MALGYGWRPDLTLEMDRPSSRLTTGLYEPERVGDELYAWTRGTVTMRLPQLDRRSPWTCTIRLRGARVDPSTLPELVIAVDGVTTVRQLTPNDYEDVPVTLPPRAQPGGVITLTASPTFTPGPQDNRALGVMIDDWRCSPAAGTWVRAPRRAIITAAIAGAVLSGAVALVVASPIAVVAAATAIAVAQAVPMTSGHAMFTDHVEIARSLAVWIAGLLVLGVWLLAGVRRRPLSTAATFVWVFTVLAVYLKLLVLLHPSKPLIDALFHAHRLEWVLAGRYFFTQIMPGGVQFPYAIGLYVFTAPWTIFTTDYITLLRVVVTVAEASGGVLVYLMVVRAWGDRPAGALAAVLFTLVPRTYEVVGNANMTSAFAQAVAVAVIAAATMWPLSKAPWRWGAGLTLLTAAALLSHVGTFVVVMSTMVLLAGLSWWRGGASLRSPARVIAASALAAAVLSVVVYYGHFGEAYRSAATVRAESAAASQDDRLRQPEAPLTAKISEAAILSVATVGWPLLILAALGAPLVVGRGLRDRVSLAVVAWIVTGLTLILVMVLAPVEGSFQRYAAEFLSRVTVGTSPAIVILAGMGAAWAWRRRGATRMVGLVLLGAAAWLGIDAWLSWLR